jgi:hypothetical protein
LWCGPVALRYARCSPGLPVQALGSWTRDRRHAPVHHPPAPRGVGEQHHASTRRRRVSKASLARHGRASPAKPKHGRAEDSQAAANYHRTAMFCKHSYVPLCELATGLQQHQHSCLSLPLGAWWLAARVHDAPRMEEAKPFRGSESRTAVPLVGRSCSLFNLRCCSRGSHVHQRTCSAFVREMAGFNCLSCKEE